MYWFLKVLIRNLGRYTGSLVRADFTGAFFTGAQFQKVPELFGSCGFLHCARTSEGLSMREIWDNTQMLIFILSMYSFMRDIAHQ